MPSQSYICLFLIAAVVTANELSAKRARLAAAIEKLKAEIHALPADEVKQRFDELDGFRLPPPPHQDKIDHVVVLLMENHAFDHVSLGAVSVRRCAC